MEAKQRKAERAQRDQLLTLVNGWDPMGLLESGAPRDKYDSVIDELLSLLSNKAAREDVAAFLDRALTARFGTKPKDVDAFANRAVTWFQLASAQE